MSVVIRLRRIGEKKRPVYRIVALDSRKKRDGAYLESVGQYNPNKTSEQVTLDKERVEYWVKEGAKLSDTVRSILKKEGMAVAS